MDIKQLKFLDALAHERHFGRAAAACFISQPTLSLRIRQLEDELGISLIYRANRFEGFTPEGERVLSWARRVLANYEGLYQEVALIKGQLHGTLRLGVIPSALSYSARLTTPFLEAHPQVAVISRAHSADEISQLLEDFSLDIGITYTDRPLPSHLHHRELYRETYVALVPEALALNGASLGWQEAATLPLCLLTPDMHNRWIIDHTFASVGCQVQPQLQSSSLSILYAHVNTGHWAAIVPSFHAAALPVPAGVRILPLRDPHVEHAVGLVWRASDPLSPLVLAFQKSL